jgi:hypothetical protein
MRKRFKVYAEGGEIADYQIKKDGKYLSAGMDGNAKWYESPDKGYTYTKADAESFAQQLGLSNYEIVKYDKNWWKMAKGGEIRYVGNSKWNDGINENLNFKYTWEAGNGKKHTTDYTIAITNRKWDGTKLDKFIVENKQRIPSEMLNGKEFNSIEEAKKALLDYYKIDKSNNMGIDPDYGRN